MENELLEYAGYDAIDTYLNADMVVFIAFTQRVLHNKISLLPVHEKILNLSHT